MGRKWKDFSFSKQALILIVIAFFLYNVTANLPVVVRMVRSFMNVLAPFIIGAMIAYFLSRPVIKLDEYFSKSSSAFVRKKSHILATLAIFLIVIATITMILIHVLPIIIGNIRDFIDNLELYYHNAIDWVRNLGDDHWLYNFLPEIPAANEDVATEIIDALTPDSETVIDTGLLAVITTTLGAILSNLLSFGTSLLNFGMGMIVALYLLLYRTSVIALINRIATSFIKPTALSFLKKHLHRSNEIFYKFISAQFLDACILGTLSLILLWGLTLFGVRIEYVLTLALLLGLCNMVPFFGSIFASLVTTVITLFTGGVLDASIVLGSLLVLQQIDANFISPKITSDVLGLNPLLIIMSIFVLGSIFGIIGMFVAVPIAAICKVFLEDYLALREEKLANETNTELNSADLNENN